MTNRQLEFVLKLRDEASRAWEAARARISAGAQSLKSMFGSLGGILGGIGAYFGARAAIDASNEAEAAGLRLTSALQGAGIASQELNDQMLALSQTYQKTTTFEDDAVTSAQALLVTYTGMAGKALEPLLAATADYASALQIGIEESAKMIGKSLQAGTTLRNLKVEYGDANTVMERAAILQQAINDRMGDFAENEGQSAVGTMARLRNEYGNLLETIGDKFKAIIVPIAPAIIKVLDLVGRAVQFLVAVLEAAFSQIFYNIALFMRELTWGMEKLGLVGRDTVDYWNGVMERGARIYKEAQEKMQKALAGSGDSVATSISAVGTAATETSDEVSDAADKLAKAMQPLVTQEITFMSDEQKQRFEEAAKLAERITNWMRQSSGIRARLMEEQIKADMDKRLGNVQGVAEVPLPEFEVALTEWEQYYSEISKISRNFNRSLISNFDMGIDQMVRGMLDGTLTMGQAFHQMAMNIVADLIAMIAKLLIFKLLQAGFNLLTGGTGEIFTTFAESSPGGGIGQDLSLAAAGGGGSISPRATTVVFNVRAMDARSVKEWLGQTDVRASIIGTFRDAFAKEKI